MSGKGIAAVLFLVGVALVLTFVNGNKEHSVSFTLCSASTTNLNSGSPRMSAETSAGRFLVTDLTLIKVLGGVNPKVGEKFDGQYVGSEAYQLKGVSPAQNLDRIPPCKK